MAVRLDPSASLGREYTASEARLCVEFDIGGERHHYRIQWWESDAGDGGGVGWHCDATEPEYGPVHLQIDGPDGTTTRESAEYVEDEHPYRSVERWLGNLPTMLEDLG